MMSQLTFPSQIEIFFVNSLFITVDIIHYFLSNYHIELHVYVQEEQLHDHVVHV